MVNCKIKKQISTLSADRIQAQPLRSVLRPYRSCIMSPQIGYLAFLSLGLYYVNAVAGLVCFALSVLCAVAWLVADSGRLDGVLPQYSGGLVWQHSEGMPGSQSDEAVSAASDNKTLICGMCRRDVGDMQPCRVDLRALYISKAFGALCLIAGFVCAILRVAKGETNALDTGKVLLYLPLVYMIGYRWLCLGFAPKAVMNGQKAITGSEITENLIRTIGRKNPVGAPDVMIASDGRVLGEYLSRNPRRYDTVIILGAFYVGEDLVVEYKNNLLSVDFGTDVTIAIADRLAESCCVRSRTSDDGFDAAVIAKNYVANVLRIDALPNKIKYDATSDTEERAIIGLQDFLADL